MIHLTNDCWKKFRKDGLLFEELVGNLLALEYPGKKFKKTQTTHDGSRDWETSLPLLNGLNADIWFECKYRKERLSAEEVAMTLIMAYVEDAKQIIFFSYSPVNREFTKKISRFSERSKISVSIYDDTTLETMIIRHWNELDTDYYFPDVKPKMDYPVLKGITACYEVYQNDQLISCHKTKDLPVVRFNDILTIRIILFSHDSEDEQIVILSTKPKEELYFLICNESFNSACNQKSIAVPHNGITSFSIQLKPRCFGSAMKLPTIFLEWGNEKRIIRPGAVECQWLAEAPLIGQAFHDIVYTQGQFMRNHLFTVSQITGHSGVGKSRLLHEIKTQAYILGKQFFFVDNDLKKIDYYLFVRKLVSLLEGLPELSACKNVNALGLDASNIATQILYSETYLSNISEVELANYLYSRMKEKEIWLILDNVQWMDERTLKLLNLFLEYAGQNSDSGILMVFNQDYIYSGSQVDQLLKNIQAYSAQHPESVRSEEIKGFTYPDALAYLQECLTYHPQSDTDELDYEQTLTKVIDHCGTQPFFLQNMLVYLSQKHVLERTDKTSFYLTSIQDFWKCVQEIPQSVIALLERRIQLTSVHFESIGQQKMFQDVCAVLSFCGTIPGILCRELFGKFPIMKELMKLGILHAENNGNISFYHQYFEQYFKQVYPLEFLPSKLLEGFCIAIDKRHIQESMLESYFLAQYTLGTCEQALLIKMMEKLVNWDILPRLSSAVKKAVFFQLENNSEQLPDGLVASCYSAMCFMTANREGIQEACYYYEKCYSDLIVGNKGYITHRNIIFPVIREYLLSLGNLNHNQEVLDRANKLLPYSSTSAEYCAIREILCISNYAIGQTEKAIHEIKDAIQNSSTDEEQIGYIQEYGRAYYFAPNAYQYRMQISEQLDKAFSVYRSKERKITISSDIPSLQRDISVWLNAGISDLIQGRMEEAEQKMHYLTRYLDHTQMPFYEIKIRFFKAMVLLLRDVAHRTHGFSHSEICKLLNQASDICVVYYNMQDYPICFYLRASAQLHAGLYEEAVDNYKKTCFILQKHIENAQEECIWSYFYEDMALRFSQMHEEFPQEILQKIHSKKLREKIRKLANCNSPEDEIYQCDRSPISYGNSPWGLPKI